MQIRMQHRDAGLAHETRAYRIQIKAISEDGTIEGYGSVFDVTDAYSDRVVSGAFAKSLAAHRAAGTMPAMLWQHDAEKPIGVWTDLQEDAHGLRVRGQLALETRGGKEAHVLCKMGAVNGLSIGFVSQEWKYDRDPTGEEVRTLTAVDLWEVSLVTFPANTEARVTGVKATRGPITTIREAEQALRDVGLSAGEAKEIISLVKKTVIEERDARDASAAAHAAAQRVLNILNQA